MLEATLCAVREFLDSMHVAQVALSLAQLLTTANAVGMCAAHVCPAVMRRCNLPAY